MRALKQFRLSTAIVMMLLAGALVGANVGIQRVIFMNHEFTTRGWPLWWAYDEKPQPAESSSIDLTKMSEKILTPAPSTPDAQPAIQEHKYPTSGTDAAYLADDRLLPRRRLADEGIVQNHGSAAIDSDIDDKASKLMRLIADHMEVKANTSQIKHSLKRNAVVDWFGALAAVLVVGAAFEYLMRWRSKRQPHS